jgi:hypothetical protein
MTVHPARLPEISARAGPDGQKVAIRLNFHY